MIPRPSSEERLRLALDARRLGLWEADLHDGSVEASARARRLLDCRAGEALSLDAWQERTLPQDRARLKRWFAGICAAHRERSCSICHRVRTRSGEEVWLEVSGRVLIDGEGHAERVVGTVLDITERKDISDRRQAMRDLRDREQRLQLALDASGLHTWTFEPRTGRIGADPGLLECFALTADRAQRRGAWLRRVVKEDRRRLAAGFAAALSGGHKLDLEFRVDLGGGRVRWLQARALLVDDELPRLYGVCGEITARKRQEQAMRERSE